MTAPSGPFPGEPETPARGTARQWLRPLRAGGEPGTGPPVRMRGVLGYSGARFAGWQRQSERVTVQELVEAALSVATGAAVRVAAAGRTDTGVHAEGQVVAFDTATTLPPEAVAARANQVLPPDVRFASVGPAAPDFDPQRHAVGKTYRYTVPRHRA